MINGYVKDELAGSGMVVWKGREMYAAGEINREEFIDYVSRGYVQDTLEVRSKLITDLERHRWDIVILWVLRLP